MADQHYIALLLTADAQLEAAVPAQYLTTQEYRNLWNEYLNLPVGKVHKIYLDTTLYRGYDTSAANADYRAAVQYQIYKGGVIVLAVDDINEAYEKYKSGYSIGKQILNGYGQCELYCGESEYNGK